MKGTGFSLKPFHPTGFPPLLEITGDIKRSSNKLSVSYALTGPLTEIMVPAPEDLRLRRDRLWEETCFEFFISPLNSEHYWEFNLSPSGHWNVYSFTFCREGMQEEPAFNALPFSVLLCSNSLQLSLKLDLDKIVPANQAINTGISAVIKTKDKRLSFWALEHKGPQPDFHRKDVFLIALQGNPSVKNSAK